MWEFPGSPVVGTPRFHCWGPGVQSLVGELGSCKLHSQQNKTNKEENVDVNIYDIRVHNDFLAMTSKPQATKEKN